MPICKIATLTSLIWITCKIKQVLVKIHYKGLEGRCLDVTRPDNNFVNIIFFSSTLLLCTGLHALVKFLLLSNYFQDVMSLFQNYMLLINSAINCNKTEI